MTTQKHTVGNATVSRAGADNTTLPIASAPSAKSPTSHRDNHGLGYAKAVNPSTAMGRCIARHRHLLNAVDRYSRRRAANFWGPRAAVAWLGLAASRFLERSARRRLIRLKAVDSCEAEQKVLYLIAAAVAQKMDLQPKEIADIAASVEQFKPGIADLLQARDT